MAELKNSFTQGKMNKDLDERIIPGSEYREALNIGVANSENSDVGAAQNILGNVRLSCAINGSNGKYDDVSSHIAAIADPMTDIIYRFVHTPAEGVGVWMDRIIGFDTTHPIEMPCTSFVDNVDGNGTIEVANKELSIMVDIYKVNTTTTAASTVECAGGNTTLNVSGNVAQLRHGMLIYGGTILESDEILVVDVKLEGANTAILTLSGNTEEIPPGTLMTMEADRVLNFHPDRYITGINILDGMIFWTDNYSEPKKINIEKSKLGSTVQRTIGALEYGLQNFDQHTLLMTNKVNPLDCVKVGPNACGNSESMILAGCTSIKYVEYDPLATENDGSCATLISQPPEPLEGCMDNPYSNNSTGTTEVGTNRPPQWIGPATNYNPNANVSTPDACTYTTTYTGIL